MNQRLIGWLLAGIICLVGAILATATGYLVGGTFGLVVSMLVGAAVGATASQLTITILGWVY